MIEIAKIVKPQGIKGEVKAIPSTNVVEVFDKIKECLVGKEVMHVSHLSFRQGFLYIKFDEIKTRNDAENYRNFEIKIDKKLLEESKGEDEFLIDDLIGLVLYDDKGEMVGQIVSVQNFGASDIFVIEKEGRTYEVPFIPEVFKVEEGCLTVDSEKLLEVMI